MPGKKPTKPTVFLSHSSKNRRELFALKRFLDERAGGMIEFFLSSDDESIEHGTIWPEKVRDAMDRMALMFVFASPDALNSRWTFFEAGYGFHKLKAANVYCLPGTDRGSLPSPFDMLQSRNLHSARDLGLLIRQLNERLNGRMVETTGRADFDRIFEKPLRGFVEPGPRLASVVETIEVKTEGPPDSGQLFLDTCKRLGYPATTTAAANSDAKEWASTGVRIAVEKVFLTKLRHVFEITHKEREAGYVEVESDDDGGWRPSRHFSFRDPDRLNLVEVEVYNAEAAKKNEVIARENEEIKKQPRKCSFTLVPIDLTAPTKIVDRWATEARVSVPFTVTIQLLPGVTCETREEAIGVKTHDSSLTLQSDGTLLWNERIIVNLEIPKFPPHPRQLRLSPRPGISASLADFQIEELLSSLCELQVVFPPPRNNGRRKK